MDYEKLYKEALERAEKELQTCGSLHCDAAQQIFRFFPELKKSKSDWIEEIRKELKSYLGQREYKYISESDAIIEWLNWIEKQGEQKPAEWSKEDENFIKDLCNLLAAIAKDGYVGMYYAPDLINGIQSLTPQSKQEWNEKDESILNEVIVALSMYAKGQIPYTLPSQLLKDVDWLKSLKYKVLPQPKQEWSEEDEKMLSLLDSILEYAYNNNPRGFSKSCMDLKIWLKSLKPKPHWEPSEEQIEALNYNP